MTLAGGKVTPLRPMGPSWERSCERNELMGNAFPGRKWRRVASSVLCVTRRARPEDLIAAPMYFNMLLHQYVFRYESEVPVREGMSGAWPPQCSDYFA